MKAMFLALVFSSATLLGLAADARAREHSSFRDTDVGRGGRGDHHDFGPAPHHDGYKKPSFLRGSYAYRDGDRDWGGRRGHGDERRRELGDRDRRHGERHRGHDDHRRHGELFRALEHDPSPAFGRFWHATWDWGGSFRRSAWWRTIAWGWDHHDWWRHHRDGRGRDSDWEHHKKGGHGSDGGSSAPAPAPAPSSLGGGPGGGGPDGSGPGGSGPGGGGPGGGAPGGSGPSGPYAPSGYTPKPPCPPPIPVPEPGSLPILVSGLILAAWMSLGGNRRLKAN